MSVNFHWEARGTLDLVVGGENVGLRLDRFLAGSHLALSRSRAQALIEQGLVLLDDRPTKVSQTLRLGQRVSVTLPDPKPILALPEELPLAIVFEDSDFVVVDKPRGMATHPAPGTATGTLVNALLARVGDLSGIGGALRPGIVHRLDKDTSGLLVVAKNDLSHRSLQEQIRSKSALRQYLALVSGVPRDSTFTIDAPIGRSLKQRIKMAVVEGGRSARTHARILERFSDCALVELTLDTGRTHQIRVHLAHYGHPVLGDSVYGTRVSRHSRVSGQLLHAFKLQFDHPRSGERLYFEAPLPVDFSWALSLVRSRGHWY